MNLPPQSLVSLVSLIALSTLLATPGLAQRAPRTASTGAARPAPQRLARNVRPSAPANRAAATPQPSWIPLPPKHVEYIDQILRYWEHNSSQIKRYRCRFKRWIYDPEFGPSDNTPRSYSEGRIMYSAPDKGLFRVEKCEQYQPPKEPGGRPTYEPVPEDQLECWICDGHWVYQYDHQKKRLIQQELPPDMRGKAIAKGPLPFMFNAKAKDIRERFWLRIQTPGDVKNEYWLEAVPKTQDDAANFQSAQVIIDGNDFLPKAIVLRSRALQPPRQPGQPAGPPPPSPKTTFLFEKREVNFSVLAQQLNLFHREFYEPDVPSGWTKVVERWEQPAAPSLPSATTPRGTGGVQQRTRR